MSPLDRDEQHVLDALTEQQADEVVMKARPHGDFDLADLMRYEKPFMTWEEEQAYIRSIDNHVNVIYPSKAVIKRDPVGGQTHD